MATIETLQAVTNAITVHGFSASLEYPGFVLVHVPNSQQWCVFGTANGDWGGDVEDAHGIVIDAVPMADTVPGDSTDIDAIVTALVNALTTVTAGTRN